MRTIVRFALAGALALSGAAVAATPASATPPPSGCIDPYTGLLRETGYVIVLQWPMSGFAYCGYDGYWYTSAWAE
jgi:hypothetical protein